MRRLARSSTIDVACPAGRVLRLHVADSFAARVLGLSWSRALPSNHGLLIPRCRSVHGVGMLRSTDVVFVEWAVGDPLMRVLAARLMPALGFARIAARGARVAVLELNAGQASAAGMEPGAELFVLDL